MKWEAGDEIVDCEFQVEIEFSSESGFIDDIPAKKRPEKPGEFRHSQVEPLHGEPCAGLDNAGATRRSDALRA